MNVLVAGSNGYDKQWCGIESHRVLFSDDNANGDDSGDRRTGAVYVDCEDCEEHGCYDDDYESDEHEENEGPGEGEEGEDVYESLTAPEAWAYDIAGCTALNKKYLGYDLYASFMCNSHGNGVDIAVFLDEECTLYTNLKSVLSILEQTGNDMYMYKAYLPIVYPFHETIDCAITEYYPPQGYEYEYEGDGDAGGLNEMCTALFAEGYTYPLDTCGVNANGNVEEKLVKTQENHKFYKYVLSYENSTDDQAACQVIQNLDGRYCAALNYEDISSGKFFKYKNREGITKCRLEGSRLFGPSVSMHDAIVLVLGAVMFLVMLGVFVHEKLKRNRRGNRLLSTPVANNAQIC